MDGIGDEVVGTELPPDLVGVVEQLLELVEARTGWTVTQPPSTLEIVQEVDGRFKLYGKGRLHLQSARLDTSAGDISTRRPDPA